jgi:hypothetical protein
MMRTLAVVLAAIVLGCGSGGSGDAEPSGSAHLRIDMRPVDEMKWTGVLEADASNVLRGNEVIAFAWGGDYPRTLDITIEEAWSTCGMLRGTFTLESVVAQDQGLDVVITGTDAFRVAPVGEGDFAAVVRGTFVAESAIASCVGAEAELELTLTVPVRRPVGVEIDPPDACDTSDRFRVESDAQLAPGAYVRLVDTAGTAFHASNAATTHPATLVLEADEGTSLALHTPDDGFTALVVSGAAGPVTVSAFEAEQAILEHVAPAAIDVVGAQFELLGFGGGPTPLVSGQVYGDQGWSRTSASIGVASSGLEVDGEQICTVPRAAGFVLDSSTPEVCTAYAEVGHGTGPFGDALFDAVVPVSAEVLASGTCRLRLGAAEYSGGEGFSTELSVEIRNADSLIRVEGR